MYKLFNKIFGRSKITPNINTDNNMSNIIRPGHYKSKYAGDSGNHEIIRVLGESDTPGMFNLQELDKNGYNKLISEHRLVDDYEFIYTAISKDDTLPKVRLDLDFDDESLNDEIIDEIPVQQQNEQNHQIIPVVSTQPSVNFHQAIQLSDDEQFVLNILQKFSISKNNQKFNTNFPKQKIKVELEIPIDYDFQKLKESINLFGLDKNIVTKFLVIDNEIKNSIDDILKLKILELFNKKEIEDIVTEPIINIVKPVIVEEIQEKMETKLITDENDPRIQQILNKVSLQITKE